MSDKTKFQVALVEETAHRLLADGNPAAACVLKCLAASLTIGAENELAQIAANHATEMLKRIQTMRGE